tara:strand:- start:2484 stop:3749 length:1266 start_codon:yes stop_codon:yes gene_type:complete
MKEIQQAEKRMFRDHPFYTCLYAALKKVEDPAVSTMCTDGREIRYNPEFVLTLSIPELLFVLCHEVLHVAFLHQIRRGERDFKLWNIAADYAINGILIKAGLVMPKDGLHDPRFDKMKAEKIYDLLKDERNDPAPSDDQGESGDDTAQADSQGGEGETSTDSSGGNQPATSEQEVPWGEVLDGTNENGSKLSEVDKAEIERETASRIYEASQVEKRAGTGTGGNASRGALDSMKAQELPWHEILQDSLIRSMPCDVSFSNPNRRFLHSGLIIAGNVYDQTGDLVIAIDTSGSQTVEELKVIAGRIEEIVDVINPRSVVVIYCDSTINGEPQVFERGEDIKLEERGGGGTAFNPPFNWVDHAGLDPHALIYFTDGLGSVGPDARHDFTDPDYPVFWITTFDAPSFAGCEEFGEVIEVRDRNY